MRDQRGKFGRTASRNEKSSAVRSASMSPGAPELLRPTATEPSPALLETDLRGVITVWNVGAERIFGYTSRQAVGQPLSFIIAPTRRAEQDEATARAGHGETIG